MAQPSGTGAAAPAAFLVAPGHQNAYPIVNGDRRSVGAAFLAECRPR
jgi:hypothetical protein